MCEFAARSGFRRSGSVHGRGRPDCRLNRGADARAKTKRNETALGNAGTSGSEKADADVQVAQAAVDSAELDISFTRVRAPISGRAGAVLVREGNLVRGNGGAPLVVINQMAPIQARFAFHSSPAP